jgi:hypothetical protein
VARSNDPAKRERQLANLDKRPAVIPRPAQPNLRHGGQAAVAGVRLTEREEAIREQLEAIVPLRASDGGLPPEDRDIVTLMAMASCRLEDVREYISLLPFVVHGKPASPTQVKRRMTAMEVERGLRREILGLARELGLSPRARVSLGVELQRGLTAHEALQAHLDARYGGDDDGEAS